MEGVDGSKQPEENQLRMPKNKIFFSHLDEIVKVMIFKNIDNLYTATHIYRHKKGRYTYNCIDEYNNIDPSIETITLDARHTEIREIFEAKNRKGLNALQKDNPKFQNYDRITLSPP